MAIDLGTSTVTLSSQERTWRINLETPLGQDPTITVYREDIKKDGNNAIVSQENAKMLSRNLSAVASEAHTVGDKTYTLAELATVIAAVADAWSQE